ncbi:MAG: YbhB/YbcL family Raf kinase inhibitor-like protein [Polyangia bacterium]
MRVEAALLLLAFSAGCAEKELPSFQVSSLAFGEGEPIPSRHGCDGDDLSPPLAFFGYPEETVAFALEMIDRDALSGEGVRWLIWNLSADVPYVGEGVPAGERPDGAVQGANAEGFSGYLGPCPVEGEEHEIAITVWALENPLDLSPGAGERDLRRAAEKRAVGLGRLSGTYQRD